MVWSNEKTIEEKQLDAMKEIASSINELCGRMSDLNKLVCLLIQTNGDMSGISEVQAKQLEVIENHYS